MTPEFAADIGNSRVKWAGPDGVVRLAADPPTWTGLPVGRWAVAGVVPRRVERFAEHLRRGGSEVLVLCSHHQIPIGIDVRYPDQVGLDRLLDAAAARSRTGDALIVDVGTAVTIDRLSDGVFRGGAILPGLRAMARALHDTTALLPLVDCTIGPTDWPGRDTESAIRAGVAAAIAGAVERLGRASATIFLTGGDAPRIAPLLPAGVVHWPAMTLDGIRICAEHAPGG